jgi:hypothetical protein
MSVFFNGRLLVSPATSSLVDDSAMRNKNLTVANVLALVGTSEGGAPNTPLKFGSPSEARAMLRSGPLLDAVERAFDPSPQTFAPSTVMAVRANPAVQAALMLKASATNIINLQSTDYGLWTNEIKAKVETATNKGKRLSTQVGNDYYSQDDVYRDAFSVHYTGAQATSRMSITGTTLTLEAPNSTVVATIDLATYNSVRKLVDRINSVSSFTAVVLDGNDEKVVLNGLDYASNVDVKTATVTATANLQAIVDWFNGYGEGYVTATRQASVGVVPDNVAWTYLAGGSNGTTTSTEWAAAFTTLQSEDVQWVVPLTSDVSIHAQADTHCTFMSNVARMERRCLVGGAAGQTIAEAKAAAKALNSDRTSQCYPGFYDYDNVGALTLYPSYMTAAMVAAAFAGSNPGTSLTNKALKVRGMETKLRNPTDTDDLILSGVLCIEETARGYKVVKSISTWRINDNYNRVEVSTGFAVDFTARNVRNAVDDLRGSKGTPAILAEAGARVESTLRELARPEPMGPGVLAGDEINPAYKNIQVSLDGDVMRIEFECSPVIPLNYILCVLHAVPYSGSVSV